MDLFFYASQLPVQNAFDMVYIIDLRTCSSVACFFFFKDFFFIRYHVYIQPFIVAL